MKYPDFKVDMGFGLHHGWAIEGAIGSEHKVDVSYLSPHVNMSARLGESTPTLAARGAPAFSHRAARAEAATKQFGVPLLMSGSFVKLLSAQIRCVRTQTFLGRLCLRAAPTAGAGARAQEAVPQDRPGQGGRLGQGDRAVDARRATHPGPGLHARVPRPFPRPAARDRPPPAHRGRAQPQAAERAYIAGQWNEAMTHLQKCRSRIPGDGPTTAMIGAIEDLGEHSDGVYFAPPRWPGYRKLQSK